MNCIKCGNPTEGNKIICTSCIDTKSAIKYVSVHNCRSFMQMKDAPIGVCQNILLCTPIKKALKNESLFMQLGHVVCPYASANISYITYRDFSNEEVEEYNPQRFRQAIQESLDEGGYSILFRSGGRRLPGYMCGYATGPVPCEIPRVSHRRFVGILQGH